MPFGSERHITCNATEEPKLDGFRALAYVESGQARLASRRRHVYRSFPALAAGIAAAFAGHELVLDGEIVHLGPDGVPKFAELMRRRRPQHFFAFDLLWLDGRDLRQMALVDRKRLLAKLVPPQPSPVLALDHVVARGVELFEAICARDMEGIVAKLASGRYEADATTWVKIKNPAYSQAESREEFFDGPEVRAGT